MTDDHDAPGWYRDPTGQAEARYWDGVRWTESASQNGVTVSIPIDPSQAHTPPMPGTEVRTPPPPGGNQTVTVVTKRSPVGAIIGGLVAVLVVILIIVVIANNDSSDDAPDPGENPPAATTPSTADG